MAIAKVEINSLIDFREEIRRFTDTIQNAQNQIESLEKVKRDIENEIREFENVSRKCDEITSELEAKLSALEIKRAKLEADIERLSVEIGVVEGEIAVLSARVAALTTAWAVAPLKEKYVIGAELKSAQEQLKAAKSRKESLVRQRNQKKNELEKTKNSIKDANELLKETSEMKSNISDDISSLTDEGNDLNSAIRDLSDALREMENYNRNADDCLSNSREKVENYLEVSIENVSYSQPKAVAFRKCLNREYAGKEYDYQASRDDNDQVFTKEQIKYYQDKYPGIRYSDIDSYGNTYPGLSKYELLHYTYPPVTKENLANRTCLIGDSKTGSADFKKFRESMEKDGYSKQEIAKLLSTNTIHHDEDGCTLRLIPRDLHKACRHNGGAEKIRLQIAMISEP